MADPEASPPEAATRTGWRDRSWLTLFALSFVLMLAGAVALLASVRGFLSSTQLLYVSAVFSGLAVVSATASLVMSRRR